MTWAFCTCGWVGIGDVDSDVFGMHYGALSPNFMAGRVRKFNQPHMASEGVERLLAEAKRGKA